MLKSFLLFVVFALSSVCHADVAPAHLEKAKELFQVMDLETQMGAGFDAMAPIIDQLGDQLNLDAEGKKELTAVYKDWFDQDIDRKAMMEKLAEKYAETYTVDELDQLIAFYETDLGQKTIVKMGELANFGAKLGMDAAMAKQVELQNRIQAFIESKRDAAEGE